MNAGSIEGQRPEMCRRSRRTAGDGQRNWRPLGLPDGKPAEAGGHAGDADRAFLRWFEAKLRDSDAEPDEDRITDYLIAIALTSESTQWQ